MGAVKAQAQTITYSPSGIGIIGSSNVSAASITSGTPTFEVDVDANSTSADVVNFSASLTTIPAGSWTVNIRPTNFPSTATSRTYTYFTATTSSRDN